MRLQAAHAAMAKDGLAVASTSSAPPPPLPKPKPADPFANYSTAADLGFVDREEEKRKAQELLKQAEVEAAAELERETRHTEGTIGQWERVVRKRPPPPPPPTYDQGDSKPRLGEDGQGQEEEEQVVERDEPIPTSANFLKEKRAVDDDDGYDPTKISINLKRKRLTLKEEQDIKQAQGAKERLKREAEEAELRRITSAMRNQTTAAGWSEVDVKAEPMLEFEPLPEVKHEEAEGVKDEDELKPAELKAEDEEAKPVVSSGFKKRKMHGAAAARRKP